jgi:hypothetical protein
MERSIHRNADNLLAQECALMQPTQGTGAQGDEGIRKNTDFHTLSVLILWTYASWCLCLCDRERRTGS